MEHLSYADLQTPVYLVQKQALQDNLELLAKVKQKTGCKILLAQKAFSMFCLYPFIGQYLDGTTASGLFEARLGKQEMGGETHVFCAAYSQREFPELLRYADHIVFNSFAQFHQFGPLAHKAGKSCGIRVNPACSTQEHAIYDPCAPGSRLGVLAEQFAGQDLTGLSGLHFHTLCEQNADALATTLQAVEAQFGSYLHHMQWLNFGGGHHITRPDYDIDLLCREIIRIQDTYQLQVYLEPGEAVALRAGLLISTVLDVVENGGVTNLILDTSAACHMPDVIEMPYRPPVAGSGMPGEKAYTYRLTGPTCLAGDIIGDYSFDHPLCPGDRVVFEDMAIYTMVKNNTFNGMNLPDIALEECDGSVQLVRRFGYEDFKNRLS